MDEENKKKNQEIEELLHKLDQKEFKEEMLSDEFLGYLQNYMIETCLTDSREKFKTENISRNDFEKYLKSRLRFFVVSAYMLGKNVKNL